MLLISAALADTIRVPSDYATVAEAVNYASITNGPDEIVVSSAYTPAAKAVDVKDQTLTFVGDGASYQLEPLFGEGATLAISDASFTVVDDWDGSPFSLTSPCSLCIRLGSVTLYNVDFQGAQGYGIIVVDTDLFATDLSMTGGRDGRSLASVALTDSVVLELTTSVFEGNVGGAVKLYGDYGYQVQATLDTVDFVNNFASEGASIYARNTELQVFGGLQSGNVSRSSSPLDLEGTIATFDGVQFDGNTGSEGNVIKANMNAGGVSIKGGTIQNGRGTFGDVVAGGGGMLSFVDVVWTPQGALFVNASRLSISGGLWMVGGRSPGVVYGLDADITWRGSTVCGEGGNASGFQGLLRGDGGALRFEQNVVQSVVSDSAGLISGGGLGEVSTPPRIEVYDNTILGIWTTALVDGEAESLAFVNNIVVDSTAAFGMSAWPMASQGEFNLYDGAEPESTAAAFPDGWAENDIIGVDPAFISTFDASICGSVPYLRTGSPAIDAGSPDRTDDYGVGASDIGAFDGGYGEEVGDSGEPIDSDTATDPKLNDGDGDGIPNGEDCAPMNDDIYQGATDLPNDGLDQNCDGTDATLTYGGGCQGFALQLTGLSLLLLTPFRRRR